MAEEPKKYWQEWANSKPDELVLAGSHLFGREIPPLIFRRNRTDYGPCSVVYEADLSPILESLHYGPI